MLEISSKSITGLEVILKFPEDFKPKKESNLSVEEGNKLLRMAYEPLVNKLALFLSYAIGTNDFESIKVIEETMFNIANERLKNQ